MHERDFMRFWLNKYKLWLFVLVFVFLIGEKKNSLYKTKMRKEKKLYSRCSPRVFVPYRKGLPVQNVGAGEG